jgi:hypothetical protein
MEAEVGAARGAAAAKAVAGGAKDAEVNRFAVV